MGNYRISPETAQRFAAAWNVATSLKHAGELAGLKTKDARNLGRIRCMVEDMLGIKLPSLNPKHKADNFPTTAERIEHKERYSVVIFSDGHFWPNQTAAPFWILLKVLEEVKPDYVIDNGDSFDGATVSRFAKSTFEHLPTLAEEYECVTHHLGMVKEASGKAKLLRNVGNHDLRFEGKLASNLPEMEGMPGMTTHELFPDWSHNYAVVLNGHTYIKHNWKGGMYAAANNTKQSGVNFISAHSHRLLCYPYTDFTGTRYGIECGTLADIYGPQFSYSCDDPRNWQQGFVVLTVDGDKIYPELVEVNDGKAIFRGKEYKA